MMEITSSFDHDNRNPRALIDNKLIVRGLSFSYHRVPKQLLRLSVLKLDGSSFGIEVSMNATIAYLKFVLEDFFTSCLRRRDAFLSSIRCCYLLHIHILVQFTLTRYNF